MAEWLYPAATGTRATASTGRATGSSTHTSGLSVGTHRSGARVGAGGHIVATTMRSGAVCRGADRAAASTHRSARANLFNRHGSTLDTYIGTCLKFAGAVGPNLATSLYAKHAP